MMRNNSQTTELIRTQKGVGYLEALKRMEERVAGIASGLARENLWLLEHPPLYTAGTSADLADLVAPGKLPLYETGRGGQLTYHGPGQRIAYVMLDLNRRGRDLRQFVHQLEAWIVATLEEFGIVAQSRTDRVGVWVPRPDHGPNREDKIAAIGVRVRRWVTFHGVSLNVNPDLSHYEGIVPCGISSASSPYGVTSLHDLGIEATMNDVDNALIRQFEREFGALSEIEDEACLPDDANLNLPQP